MGQAACSGSRKCVFYGEFVQTHPVRAHSIDTIRGVNLRGIDRHSTGAWMFRSSEPSRDSPGPGQTHALYTELTTRDVERAP